MLNETAIASRVTFSIEYINPINELESMLLPSVRKSLEDAKIKKIRQSDFGKFEAYRTAELERQRNSAEHTCYFKDCNGSPIRSHQISESQLATLGGDKCIVCRPVESKLLGTGKKAPLFERAAKGRALQFFGFCATCDRDKFQPLDDPNSEFSENLALLQSLRSLCYRWHHEQLEYLARTRAGITVGLNLFRAPPEHSIDPRVAKDQQAEREYFVQGYKWYRELLENEILAPSGRMAVQSVEIKTNDLDLCFASCANLTLDFYGRGMGLNWENAGETYPLIFWQFLKFNGSWKLSCVVMKEHEIFARKILDQIINCPKKIRGYFFFLMCCQMNYGSILGENFFGKLEANFPSLIERLNATHSNPKPNPVRENALKPEDFPTFTLP